MFNVSALLLDDAFKPVTPLTNGAINENQLIFDEVKAYKNGAKYITFSITRGVAHIKFHIVFVISDALLAKTLLPIAYLYPLPLDIRVYCILLELQCIA